MQPFLRPEHISDKVRSDPKRRAEVQVYDNLAQQLGERWCVWHHVSWLGRTRDSDAPRDGEADFIVAHPDKGVLVIEVKGGLVGYDDPSRKWFSDARQGQRYWIKNPYEQAMRSKHALVHKLRELRCLEGKRLEVRHAVVFPGGQAPRMAPAPYALPQITIDMEDLNRLPTRLDEVFAYWRGNNPIAWRHGPVVLNELKRMLGCSTVLHRPVGPTAVVEEQEMLQLTEEQFDLLRSLDRNRRVIISGCAGAGKTLLAVQKARALAGDGFRTLFTCFNGPLAGYLKAMTKDVAGLEVGNFHDVVRRLASSAEVPLADDDWLRYPDALSTAMKLRPALGYDAIVVDEAQDFDEPTWIALEDGLKGGREGILYVFCDTNQFVYTKKLSLPDNLVFFSLSKNLRNTRLIADAARHHYRGGEPMIPGGPEGRPVQRVVYQGGAALQRALGNALLHLLGKERCGPEDIVVLTPRSLEKSQLPGMLLRAPLKLLSIDDWTPTSSAVRLSSVRRFKGLEAPVIVVAELDEQLLAIPDVLGELCYVAFSRARSHLIVMGTSGVLERVLPVYAPA